MRICVINSESPLLYKMQQFLVKWSFSFCNLREDGAWALKKTMHLFIEACKKVIYTVKTLLTLLNAKKREVTANAKSGAP